MAQVAKVGNPSLSTLLPCHAHQVGSNLHTGEAVAAGDACYIKQSDGLVYRSDGSANNAGAVCDGFAAVKANVGEAVTLLTGVDFNYGSGLLALAGLLLYVSGTTPGGLADAASTGGLVAVAKVLDNTRIRVRAAGGGW